MKTYLLGFLLALSTLASAQQPIPFTIKGQIGHLEAPAKVFLLLDGKFEFSAPLHDGAFELKGTMDAPKPVMLLLGRSGKLQDAFISADRTFFFLEPGPIVFTSSDSLQNARVTGNPLEKEYQQLWKPLKPLNQQLTAVQSQKQAAGDEPNTPPELIRQLHEQEAALQNQLNAQLKSYISTHPNSYVSFEALQRVGGYAPRYAEIAPLFDALAPAVRNSLGGRRYAELLQVVKNASGSAPTPDSQRVAAAVEQYRSKVMSDRNEQRMRQLRADIKSSKDSRVRLAAMQELYGPVPDYAEVMPLFNSLDPAVRNSPEGQEYQALLLSRRNIAVGSRAPDFSVPTPDGKLVSLADYRGQYVLVDFWASWCGPCRAENPNLTQAYQQLQSRNFTILSVSVDDARDKWLRAVQTDQLSWPQVSELKGFQSPMPQRYQVQAIPQNFLIDPNGIIIATNLRGKELPATLARLLK